MNHERGGLHQYAVAKMKKNCTEEKYIMYYIITMTSICDEGGQ